MKTVDITIDLETCALCPTAAVMSIGAVAWDRHGEASPFFVADKEWGIDPSTIFSTHIDMRTEFVDGFTFDQSTADWWTRQSNDAKAALTECDDEPAKHIAYAVIQLFDFINDVKERMGADRVCLWSQGTDFDIAILRNICYKYSQKLPTSYQNFRDHRTFYMECAELICDITNVDFDPENAYTMVDDYECEKGVVHEPVYDCKRSIYSTWQMMNHIRCLRQDLTDGKQLSPRS